MFIVCTLPPPGAPSIQTFTVVPDSHPGVLTKQEGISEGTEELGRTQVNSVVRDKVNMEYK